MLGEGPRAGSRMIDLVRDGGAESGPELTQAWECGALPETQQPEGPRERADNGWGIFQRVARWLKRLFPSLRQPEEIPRALGLSLVGVYLAGMLLIGGASWRFHREVISADAASWGQTFASQLAQSLAPLVSEDRAELRLRVAELSAEPRVISCRVILGGQIIAASRASLIGKRQNEAPGIQPAGRLGSRPNGENEILAVTAPITSPDAQESGELQLAFAMSDSRADFQRLWAGWSLALLAILLALLMVYRALREALRPAAAVQNNLLTAGSDVESRLGELRLASELGEVAEAWNRVVDLVARLRQELAGARSAQELTRALEETDRARAREILQLLPDGLMLVDEGCELVLLNQAARRLLGVPGEAGDLKLGTLTADAELNELLARMAAPDVRNHRANVFHTLRHADQETTLLLTVLKVELTGNVQGTLVLLRDVSQQKYAERARDDFLQQVTHELRTPLSNIRAYTETLMEGILDDREAHKECLNVINTEARRLGRLVEDVLQASQLEVGAVRLRVGPVDFARLLQQTVQDLQATADEKQIELRLSLPPKLPPLRADKERLAVVFTNLLGNALKYTEAHGHVTVECRCAGNLIDVAVRDTGIGIPPEELPFVFDKFFRSKSAQVRQRPGTGLGLATARHIARLHGGDITVTSEPDKGSCFSVTLPVGEAAEAAPARATAPS